jgi:hypothetical protein
MHPIERPAPPMKMSLPVAITVNVSAPPFSWKAISLNALMTTETAILPQPRGEGRNCQPSTDILNRKKREPRRSRIVLKCTYSKYLRQERAIPLRSHFCEYTCGTCIVNGESHSVLQDCEGSSGGGKTDLSCEIRRIRGIGRSRTKVLNFAHGCPGDVKCRRRVVRSWSKEKRIVDCASLGQMETRRPIAHEQRIVWNRDDPEQT